MNLLQISKKYERDLKEIENYLKTEKGIRIFDASFPISDTIIDAIEERYGKISNYDVQCDDSEHDYEEGTESEQILAYLNTVQNSDVRDIFQTLFSNPSIDLLDSCLEKGYHVVIDTSSILRKKDAFRRFYKDCKLLLLKYGKRLEVPYSVIAELGRILVLKDKDELTIKRAQFGIDLIKDEIKEGNVEIIGDRENKWENPKGGDGYFADADFTVQILKWRNQGESVLLITQDYTMSKDIIKISDLSSVQSKAEVLVRKLNALGQLVDALDGTSTEDADYEQRS